jgi:hypothetical protein
MALFIRATASFNAEDVKRNGTWFLRAEGQGVNATLEVVSLQRLDGERSLIFTVWRSMNTPNRIISFHAKLRNSVQATIWSCSRACDDIGIGFGLPAPSPVLYEDATEITLECQVARVAPLLAPSQRRQRRHRDI